MFSKWIEKREVTKTYINDVSKHLDMRRKSQNFEILSSDFFFNLSTVNIKTPTYAASWNEFGWYISIRLVFRKSLGFVQLKKSYCSLVIGIVSVAINVWIFIDVC